MARWRMCWIIRSERKSCPSVVRQSQPTTSPMELQRERDPDSPSSLASYTAVHTWLVPWSQLMTPDREKPQVIVCHFGVNDLHEYSDPLAPLVHKMPTQHKSDPMSSFALYYP